MRTRADSFSQYLRGLAVRCIETEQSDAELLGRFLKSRDSSAFAGLVHRHGPMVLGVCRRLLRDAAAAEDAFQATFLLLSKKADTLRKQESLPSWLHGVARRTALKARTSERRRLVRERRAQTAPCSDPLADVSLREALAILDEELAKLPEKYRAPLLLCCLEGRARDEAAQQLGWPAKLLKSRLEQARELLRQRLTRRGLTLSAGLFAVLLSTSVVDGAVPATLLGSTLQAAAGGAVAPPAAALAEGVLRTMFLRSVLKTSIVLLVLGLVTGGLGVYLQQAQARGASPTRHVAAQYPVKGATKTAQPAAGRIYFHLSAGSGPAIHSMEPNGQNQKDEPRADPRDDYYYALQSARFSPDGKWLAFGQARLDGNTVGPPDKIRLRDATKSDQGEVVVDMPGVELLRWVWSPDGKQLAFTSWDKDSRTRNWIVDVQTKKIEQVNLPVVKDEKQGDYQMGIGAWSPDGQHFLALGKGVHLVKRDGTLVRRLSEELSVYDGRCRFAPDGKKALLVRFNKNHSNTLFVVDLAGGKPKAIVEAANFMDMQAVWSPDGKRIAYCATLMDANGQRGEETSIFVVDADGQNTTTLRTEKHEPQEVRLVLTDWR